jgi:hypothetical protein
MKKVPAIVYKADFSVGIVPALVNHKIKIVKQHAPFFLKKI